MNARTSTNVSFTIRDWYDRNLEKERLIVEIPTRKQSVLLLRIYVIEAELNERARPTDLAKLLDCTTQNISVLRRGLLEQGMLDQRGWTTSLGRDYARVCAQITGTELKTHPLEVITMGVRFDDAEKAILSPHMPTVFKARLVSADE